MSIAILIPSGEDWKARFGQSVSSLTGFLGLHKIPHETINTMGSILPYSRHVLFEMAIGGGHKYALCLDSDMVFPMNLVDMMKHDKPIVACNYVTGKPCRFVSHDMDGNVMDSRGKTGIEQASKIALGCALVNLEYIKKLPKPWFQFGYDPADNRFTGEDYYFSELCAANNIDLWVDHDLSQEVKHIKPSELGVYDVKGAYIRQLTNKDFMDTNDVA